MSAWQGSSMYLSLDMMNVIFWPGIRTHGLPHTRRALYQSATNTKFILFIFHLPDNWILDNGYATIDIIQFRMSTFLFYSNHKNPHTMFFAFTFTFMPSDIVFHIFSTLSHWISICLKFQLLWCHTQVKYNNYNAPIC